jgi:outer membrane protein TolC
MFKLLKLLSFVGVVSLCSHAFAQTKIEINEKYLSEVASKGAPQLDQIQAAFLGVELQKGQLDEAFAPELFGRGSYAETNEKPIITFIPIFSPIKQAQLGVRQNFRQGLSAEAAVSTDQRSASSATSGKFRDVTTTILSFTLQMDVWKDLFGRLSKARLESLAMETQRAELEKDIHTKAFRISLRRIYWSLVANQEALKISEELLKTAQRQSSETNQRFRNSVAESDEVARYEAQVASRQGTLTYLQYQRETLLKQLKNLLPELMTSELALADYDLNKTFDEVMVCTAVIAQEQKIPYHFTRYDEATSLLRKVRSQAGLINSRYADPDVKLYGTVRATGVGSDQTQDGFRGSYGSSVDDIEATNRTGYEVGLSFSLPLGDVKEMNQKTKELYDEKRLSAAINNSDAHVSNTHQQLVRSVTLLNEVIRSQKVNSQQLEKRLKFMRRKYEQARASVNDLVQDQDALLSSQLTTIETQLQILNVLFDYLAIYTETPCSFNRI